MANLKFLKRIGYSDINTLTDDDSAFFYESGMEIAGFFSGRGYSRDRRGIESLEDAYKQEIPQMFPPVTSRRQRDLMTC
jgi:hypothetical protein